MLISDASNSNCAFNKLSQLHSGYFWSIKHFNPAFCSITMDLLVMIALVLVTVNQVKSDSDTQVKHSSGHAGYVRCSTSLLTDKV